MNFFEHQDKALFNTKKLILLFVLAVIALILAVNAIVYGVLHMGSSNGIAQMSFDSQLKVHLYASLITLGVIGIGSLLKIHNLSLQGGISIALDLGGNVVEHNTKDKYEKRLLNVVEEMAIASGIPVPEIFIIEEKGINAFAAGFSSQDAVIGVTRAGIKELSRDELQGVIAHEFSHIFHGDMKLNMKIMGILHGILMLSVIGRITLHSGGRRRGKSSALPLVGLLLIALGWIGVFFGRLIQAGVSRQREFLADASAVQYTRNPDGISGALVKIGNFSKGSNIENPRAEEISHFFLASAMKTKLSGLFATHPPLKERIAAINPRLNAQLKNKTQSSSSGLAAQTSPDTPPFQPTQSEQMIRSIGAPEEKHILFAKSLIETCSAFLINSCHDVFSSRAVIYSLFIHDSQKIKELQFQNIKDAKQSDLISIINKLVFEIKKKGPLVRLPLLDLCLPQLKKLSPTQRTEFLQLTKNLILADQKFHIFEYSLFKIILNSLEMDQAKKTKKPQKSSFEILISALAHASSAPEKGKEAVFQKSMQILGLSSPSMRALEKTGPQHLNTAIDELRNCPPQIKEKLIKACIHSIQADSKIEALEAEILRALGESLEIPIPPLLS